MPDGKRLWRTAKGALVEDGHKDAAFLAYGVDDALTAADAETKQAAAPRNKQAAPAKNK